MASHSPLFGMFRFVLEIEKREYTAAKGATTAGSSTEGKIIDYQSVFVQIYKPVSTDRQLSSC